MKPFYIFLFSTSLFFNNYTMDSENNSAQTLSEMRERKSTKIHSEHMPNLDPKNFSPLEDDDDDYSNMGKAIAPILEGFLQCIKILGNVD